MEYSSVKKSKSNWSRDAEEEKIEGAIMLMLSLNLLIGGILHTIEDGILVAQRDWRTHISLKQAFKTCKGALSHYPIQIPLSKR